MVFEAVSSHSGEIRSQTVGMENEDLVGLMNFSSSGISVFFLEVG